MAETRELLKQLVDLSHKLDSTRLAAIGGAQRGGFKYMGYFLGKRYQKLPEKVILFCTMNREYWKQTKE